MPTLIALAKISLGAVSVAGVGTVSAFAIKNSIDNDPTPNKIPESDQKDTGTKNLPTAPQTLVTQTSQTTVPPIQTPNPQPIPTPPTKLSVAVVKAQASQSPQTTSQLTVANAVQSYKCRLKDVTPTHAPSICKLVELSISNNWIDLAGIKQATQSTTPSLDDLKDTTKQFKLEVTADLFGKVTTTPSMIVEIVSTTTLPTVHAELSTLFKVDGNTVDYENVSTLLGRSTEAYSSIDADKQKQCLLTDGTSLSPDHNCTFRSFGSSIASPSGAGYSNQTIANFEAPTPAEFTSNQHYLLDYATPLVKTTLSKIYVNEVDSNTGTKKVTLDSVVPVIFNGSGENKKAFILSETRSFKGVVVKKDSISSPKPLTFNGASRTYKCKYDSNAAADCELRLIPFASSKASHNTSEITAITSADAVTIADTTSTNSYYKVEVDQTFFNTFKTATTPKSIEILDATDSSTRLFTLDILYHIDVNAEYEGESSYIVKTATLPSPTVSFAGGDKKYCLFAADDPSDFADAKDCEIKDLGTSIDADQNFTTTTDATSILTINTYLVTFVKSASATPPTAKDIKEKLLVFLQVTAGNASSKTKVATFAKEHIDYALIVDGNEANKFAFVLNKAPTPA